MPASYQHEPGCAVIATTDPNTTMPRCTCSREHKRKLRLLRARGSLGAVGIGDGQNSIGSGCYWRRPLRSER